MKGHLIKTNNQWMVRFFDGSFSKEIYLYSDKESSLVEGAEVEFDIYDEVNEDFGVDRFARIYIPHNF
jgi:hypothetical protein